ncbi:hypothetical protein C2S52_013206 [Perilla frutescens var. hirtella]|nr:hypothetical protein C2S52_013206 [Perilla frutescens var. hirtella]
MNGFWSENTRKLCIVGTASWEVESGNVINLDAVLKLNYASESNPTLYTNVVSGILESTAVSADDAAYFEPILIFSFPASPNYKYSEIPKEVGSGGLANESLSLSTAKFCSAFGAGPTVVELEYPMQCSSSSSRESQHCSPLGGTLPRILYLTPIECSDLERKFRYTAKLPNMTQDVDDFSLDSVMVGEASWDEYDENRQLIGVACRLLNPLSHFGIAVGDCSMKLRMWYTSVLTIRNDAKIAGELWSTKTVEDSGYFRKISLTSDHDNGVKPVKKGYAYPDASSFNMRFDVLLNSSKGEPLSWGYALPVSVENDMVDIVWAIAPESSNIEQVGVAEPQHSNISYKISLNPFPDVKASNWFPSLNGSVDLQEQANIMAEGVYNAGTGQLCMVGCRKLIVNSTYFFRDCEILVKLEFPPMNAKRGGLIKGTIASIREKEDPLFFNDLVLQSAAHYSEVAEQSIWRMDLEITMVLISNFLACVFVGIQIFHVKRNPEVPSLISLLMLVILCVGHMIPLSLNFDTAFGRLEANEVSVRVITVVALLLQIRLLQLVWTAKHKHSAWSGEKKAGFVSLSLYMIGGMLGLVLNWIRKRDSACVWGDLRCYGGLVLDGFLVPQIILNILSGSAEKALSQPFYIGTSVVRLVPHAYDQYRAHNYPEYDLKAATYYYANPAADFYSTAWDIIISCGVVGLAVVVFVQQRCGGRCILPQRLELYEKVPSVDNE